MKTKPIIKDLGVFPTNVSYLLSQKVVANVHMDIHFIQTKIFLLCVASFLKFGSSIHMYSV